MTDRHKSLSFVIPCLNEAATLPVILKRINLVCQSTFLDRDTEVVVSDNGSSDESISIAESRGVKMPAFFTFFLIAFAILAPILVLVTYLFLW